jgi:hypothetical protein
MVLIISIGWDSLGNVSKIAFNLQGIYLFAQISVFNDYNYSWLGKLPFKSR